MFAVKNCWFKLKTSGEVPVGRRSHSAGWLSGFLGKNCLPFWKAGDEVYLPRAVTLAPNFVLH